MHDSVHLWGLLRRIIWRSPWSDSWWNLQLRFGYISLRQVDWSLLFFLCKLRSNSTSGWTMKLSTRQLKIDVFLRMLWSASASLVIHWPGNYTKNNLGFQPDVEPFQIPISTCCIGAIKGFFQRSPSNIYKVLLVYSASEILLLPSFFFTTRDKHMVWHNTPRKLMNLILSQKKKSINYHFLHRTYSGGLFLRLNLFTYFTIWERREMIFLFRLFTSASWSRHYITRWPDVIK